MALSSSHRWCTYNALSNDGTMHSSRPPGHSDRWALHSINLQSSRTIEVTGNHKVPGWSKGIPIPNLYVDLWIEKENMSVFKWWDPKLLEPSVLGFKKHPRSILCAISWNRLLRQSSNNTLMTRTLASQISKFTLSSLSEALNMCIILINQKRKRIKFKSELFPGPSFFQAPHFFRLISGGPNDFSPRHWWSCTSPGAISTSLRWSKSPLGGSSHGSVCYWKWPNRNRWFTHRKWWFSIFM